MKYLIIAACLFLAPFTYANEHRDVYSSVFWAFYTNGTIDCNTQAYLPEVKENCKMYKRDKEATYLTFDVIADPIQAPIPQTPIPPCPATSTNTILQEYYDRITLNPQLTCSKFSDPATCEKYRADRCNTNWTIIKPTPEPEWKPAISPQSFTLAAPVVQSVIQAPTIGKTITPVVKKNRKSKKK